MFGGELLRRQLFTGLAPVEILVHQRGDAFVGLQVGLGRVRFHVHELVPVPSQALIVAGLPIVRQQPRRGKQLGAPGLVLV